VGLALEHVRLIGEVQRVHDDLARTARMAAVGTLAAGVAHEFNNILAAMVGYAQLGLSGTLDEKIEALRTVELVARRGKYVTTSLLAFAEGDIAQRTPARLCDLADQALLLVDRDLRSLGIATQRHYRDDVRVQVDQPQLVQAIVHLLTNARDAMLTGGVLTLSARASDGWAELSVSDTGPGIPEAVRDRLFEPFVTTKGALGGGSQNGVGLGLSICYGIVVQRHGGLIEWRSDPGTGSTFKLLLPALPDEQVAEQAALPEGASGQAALRVLVVDDDTVIQALLRAMLTRSGYTVSLAPDVESARALLRRNDTDVVLCDLGLPGADGVQLVEQLRASGNTIPVVLMTGRVDNAALRRLHAAAVSGVLTKPFQMHEVLQALQKATAGRERWG
jgi:nitrogen-specific signal transduction histidine kinase/ActR/RegA family two-component response regulator